MADTHLPLAKLRNYATKVEETKYDSKEDNEEEVYEARIKRTLQSLQNQVKQQQHVLEKVITRVVGR